MTYTKIMEIKVNITPATQKYVGVSLLMLDS